MVVAVNTRMLLKGKMEGIGYFTYESMRRITASHPEVEFHFIFDRPYDKDFIFSGNVSGHVVSPPARHPFLWYLWYEWSLPPLLKKIRPDVFVCTDGYLSLSSKARSLAVIHDLNFERYPEDLPVVNRLFYRHYFPKYARRASRIAAVSKFTKDDIVNTYNIPAEKIDIVYNGASENFKPVNDSIAQQMRNKYSSGKPFFLFTGSLHQRKNIVNLLLAFDEFKNKLSSPLHLVLAGQKRWWTDSMEKTLHEMKFKDCVHLPGRISEEDLFPLTASAFALTYVSVFEGFGIPIIEAMKSHVPVITSNVTSMPEIAGDAATLCDPFSVHSISEAMTKVFSDENFRMNLIAKGTERQKDFTWEKTAASLWKSIEHVASSK